MPECPYCFEEAPKLYEAPRLRIPAPPGYVTEELGAGELIHWHAPGSAYPGTEPFELLEVLESGELLVLAPEVAAESYCPRCWAGHTWPALHPYLVNLPPDFKLDGYRDPIMHTEGGGHVV